MNLTFLKGLVVFQIDQSDILKMPPAGACCDYTPSLEFKLTITGIFLHVKMVPKRNPTANVNEAKAGS